MTTPDDTPSPQTPPTGTPHPVPPPAPSDRQAPDVLACGSGAAGLDGPALMATALGDLAGMLLDQPLSQYLQCVVDIAARTLPEVAAVSITLVDDHARARTAGLSAPLAAPLDERQYETGFGPCLDAASTGQTIVVDTTSTTPLYPDFTALARRHGVSAAAAVGLPVPQRVVGALNLYATSGPLDFLTLERALVFASYAAIALANASAHDASVRMADQLREALTSRAVIDQAKGVLMAVHGISADEAFDRLARTSQRTNTKLRDTAAGLLERVRAGRSLTP